MKQAILFLLAATISISSLAQQLLSPNDFLPHDMGEQFTPHHLLVDYYKHVAANSPYVQVMEYGRTNEGRPLIVAFVSTPKNLKNLEAIRLNHLRRAGLAAGDVDASMDLAVTWLSYSVHGNEAAAAESAIPVLYDLANPNSRINKEWLDNNIVILDPTVNPDGYSRYTHWYRGVANRINDPKWIAREHHEPWPGGRVNHYLFDLNRDWAWATQIETQQRLSVYKQWMPHVHADLHEMYPNDPYYFAPAAQPFHAYITDWQRKFQNEVGQNNAKHFDGEGWLYFTKEVFDLFYPSYGDTYPTFNGAIGMTYEQAGHGVAGCAILMEHGDTLTLHDRIAHHKTASLSTIETASANATRLNEAFSTYFEQAQTNPQGDYRSYIIKQSNTKAKLDRLTSFLDLHNIQYGSVETTQAITAYSYTMGKDSSIQLEAGDLLISAYQPKGVLTQVLFDPRASLVDSLTYDITAWSMPYAYGLEAYASSQRLDPTTDFSTPEISEPKTGQAYAYASRWESVADAKFLGKLLQAGLKVRFAEREFSTSTDQFGKGSLLITRADNRKVTTDLDAVVRKIAKEVGQQIYAIQSGWASSGRDLGSSSYNFIELPKIAIIGDEPTYANEFGQVWHYFEQEVQYPITIIRGKDLASADLEDFNVLVLPEGRYSFDEPKRARLNKWIKSGGHLIAIGATVEAFADKKGFGLKRKKEEITEDQQPQDRLKTYGTSERDWVTNAMPGAVFKVQLDDSHPLAFGLSEHYFSLKTSTRSFPYLENAWNVGYLDNDPMIVGFAGAEAQKKQKNSIVFAVEDKGSGQITYLLDNPLYRAFWQEGKLLFSNAVFLVGQ